MKKLNFTIAFLLLSFVCVQFMGAQNLAGGVEPLTQAEFDMVLDPETNLAVEANTEPVIMQEIAYGSLSRAAYRI